VPKVAKPGLGWWGARFQQYMLDEGLLDGPLTPSQVKGAQRGDARLTCQRGSMTAQVGMGYYQTATLKVKPLTERDWKKATEAIAADADIARRFLSGTPGPELEQVLRTAGIDLFPTERQPTLRCDCHRSDCRHTRVLAVRGAALLDANPFLWLEMLGRPRDELLAAVRAQMSDRSAAAQVENGRASAAVSPERFLTTDSDPDAIAVRPGMTVAPDALLKLLGPLPLSDQFRQIAYVAERDVNRAGQTWRTFVTVNETADEVVARYLAHISQEAAGLATGDRMPAYRDDVPVGKRVPLKHRLVGEVEAAVERADSLVNVSQLHMECPTAAAVPWSVAGPALTEALALLAPEYLSLAGGYVGLRSAVLTGTLFRHVVTYTEWQRGRLDSDSDWARVLRIAGLEPPFAIHIGGEVCSVLDPEHPEARDGLFKRFRPEVGDTLQLTVVDPDGPALAGMLLPRGNEGDAAAPQTNRDAAQALCEYLAERRRWEMTETEALEVLLARGFYREGRIPDPVWLLPEAAKPQPLYWGRGRMLVVHSWYRVAPSFGAGAVGLWRDRQIAINEFAATLVRGGRGQREVVAARAVLEAWCKFWPGDQRDRRHPPAVAALLHFLWSAGLTQVRGAGERTPQVLAAWFRFLEEQYPTLRGAFQEQQQACELESACAHRWRTVPAARDHGASAAWVLEGYRWLGPHLVFA
jgi:uncharacterized Zn finger protein